MRRSLALGLVVLPLSATGVLAQSQCRGWAVSCASVEVRAEGDELILFAPNLVSSQAATEPLEAQRVGGAISGDAELATSDPDTPSCEEDDEYTAETATPDEDERKRCRRAPVGAFFFVALPASLFILAPDGQTPAVDTPGLPQEPVSTPGDGKDGGEDGDDGGAGSGGDTGATDGGSDGGGTSGDGAGTGGNSGGGNTRGGNTGGGNTGGGPTGGQPGTVGGGSTGPGSPWHPGASDLPPISQVPEPVSTTLFGLGLASLAGARIRRRRQGTASADDS